MINKRKLDEVIQNVTDEPEKHCAYSVEEYCLNTHYQEHVCVYVRCHLMPYFLAKYLYNDCYYNDIETVQANLDYINSTVSKMKFYGTWVDITMEMVQKEIEDIKTKIAKNIEREDQMDDALFDNL